MYNQEIFDPTSKLISSACAPTTKLDKTMKYVQAEQDQGARRHRFGASRRYLEARKMFSFCRTLTQHIVDCSTAKSCGMNRMEAEISAALEHYVHSHIRRIIINLTWINATSWSLTCLVWMNFASATSFKKSAESFFSVKWCS